MTPSTELKKLILIGGGAYGREVGDFLPTFGGYGTEWTFGGYIDSDADRFGIAGRIVGLIDSYQPSENEVFVCTLPDQKYRAAYVELLGARGAKFITLIHNHALVSRNAVIGEGTIIGPYCSVAPNTRIGRHSSLNSHIGVGHDCVIGNFCHINAFTLVGGFTHIADGVTIHPHCSILPRKRIGERSVVGVGSIVLRSVKRDTTVFGNPAKVISSLAD